MRTKWLGIIVLTTGVYSCNNDTYRHTSVRPTFFQEKKDLQISFDASSLFGLHSAYAITDHIGLGFTGASNNIPVDTALIYDTLGAIVNKQLRRTNITDLEFSSGYFTKIGDKHSFEVFGGGAIALSKTKIEDITISTNTIREIKNPFEAAYYRIYIQPSIGKNSKFFDYGITVRSQLIGYISSVNKDIDVIIEPSLFARIGFKKFKFMVQGGGVLPVTGSSETYTPFTVSGGFQYLLNQHTRGKREKKK
jgi:hypothetical protein